MTRPGLHVVMNRFPAKQAWDALALGQVVLRPDLSPKQKLACLRFYFDGGGVNNLFATLGRCGRWWTCLTIALALDLKSRGAGVYHYENDAWYAHGGMKYAKLDWRTPAGTMSVEAPGVVSSPVYYHTHHPYFRTRCRQVKGMKVVIVVRPILESLESIFFKHGGNPAFLVNLQDEDSFAWDRHLDEDIEFYNSWGDFAKRHPSNCLMLKYEELVADPVGTHKAICDFWGLDVHVSYLKEAIKRTTKKAMAEKIPFKAGNLRVSYRKERGVISKGRRNRILSRLRRELIHDFGYDYSENHQWGSSYGTI